MDYEQTAGHKLTLEDRRRLSVGGVDEVESFDETVVILHIADAALIIRGEGLHLRRLESGQVLVDGRIDAMVYEQKGPTGKGLLQRLFG